MRLFKKNSWGSAPKLTNEQGFTLLEMVFALTLAAVLLAVLSQFFYSAIGLQVKYDKANQDQHVLLLVYRMLDRDIPALLTTGFLPEVALQGTEDELICWNADSRGLLRIRYHFDPAERKLWRSEGFWGGEPAETLLSDAISEWKIEYYDPRTEYWLLQWHPQQRNEVPVMIRVSFKTKRGHVGPIVIPVKTRPSEASDATE